ncbi:MAG: ABC transporter substrate-binding protein [Deltaproteobacteria bacterium]|nr:ABC transporter substrate-binding protein [Deltaproteobacteria bacterium]
MNASERCARIPFPRRSTGAMVRALGVAVVVVALVTAVLGTGPAMAAEKVKFALSWTPTGRDAGFYVALDRGFFKEQGLEVEILKGQGSGDTIKRVSVGTEEFGFADTATLVVARSRGTRVKAVAMIHDRSLFAVYALRDSGIQKPKDLEGKRIGSPARSATRTVFPAFAAINHVDETKVQWTNMGQEAMVPSLLAGRVDAILMFANEFPTLRQAAAKLSKETVTILYSDYGVDVYSNGLIATDATIKERAPLVRRFVTGAMKGVAWAVERPEEAADLFVRHNPAASRPLALEFWKVAVDHLMTPTAAKMGIGYMDRAKMEATRDLITKYEKLPTTVPVEDLYTNEFLP